ncbi:MAG: LysM peptidoglycan-binding domain-containing protein [Gammaproteobacteria bacterium]
MLNKIILIFLLSGVFLLVQADTVDINPDHPDRYVVRKGDTLWDIAGHFLQEPWRWPEIWKENPQIADPNLIYPGDVVSLGYEGGSPVLTIDRETMAGEAGSNGAGRVVSGRHVKLSPEVRKSKRELAIPSIPIDVIRNFLSRPVVVNKGEMDSWPYIVSSYEEHLVAGTGTRIYIRGLTGASEVRRYAIYRRGPAYKSRYKYGSEVLGYEALYVGDAVIEKFGDPATAVISQSNREVQNGDRLLPQSKQEIDRDFIPHPPDSKVQGVIISVIDGVLEIGRYQIVVLDVGAADGLETGNVLGIYQSGHVITDRIGSEKMGGFNNTELVKYLGQPKAAGEKVQLPEEYTGIVMIFRTFGKISYGLIMESYGSIHLNDTVKNI